MVKSSQWNRISDIFNSHERFVITTHLNPDGDALGSEIALAEYLKSKNKQVDIVNISSTMYNYRFLDPDEEIILFDVGKHLQLIESAEVFIFVDISDWERMGELGQQLMRLDSPKICIDHHRKTGKFSDLDVIDESASSTGELIYDFLHHVKHTISGRIATAIYTCLLTDTGSFRFTNTTARTHDIAAELIRDGVNSSEIYEHVYESNSPNKILLMGLALTTLKFECGNRIAWFCITQEMFEQSGSDIWDTEGFPEIPRTIKGVEVSLMFTELEKNKTKISLRSKGRIIINQFAAELGGGGHNFAAGAIIAKSLQETIHLVLTNMTQLIESQYTTTNPAHRIQRTRHNDLNHLT